MDSEKAHPIHQWKHDDIVHRQLSTSQDLSTRNPFPPNKTAYEE